MHSLVLWLRTLLLLLLLIPSQVVKMGVVSWLLLLGLMAVLVLEALPITLDTLSTLSKLVSWLLVTMANGNAAALLDNVANGQ